MYIIEEKVYLDLPYCRWCGGVHVPQSKRHPERCVDCDKRYNVYNTRRVQRKKGKLPPATFEAHLKVLQAYEQLRAAGFKVPATLDEELMVAWNDQHEDL